MSRQRLRNASFSTVFHALFTASNANCARSLLSWFLSGCTRKDRLRYFFFIWSMGVSGSTCRTSNGFKLKYVDPGRSKRFICCSDVNTESRASIFFTYNRNESQNKVYSIAIFVQALFEYNSFLPPNSSYRMNLTQMHRRLTFSILSIAIFTYNAHTIVHSFVFF